MDEQTEQNNEETRPVTPEVADKEADKEKEKKSPTTRRTFSKFFLITFLICIVVIVAGIFIVNTVLDQRPMDKNSTDERPRTQTDEKLDLIYPGEGIFAEEFKDSKRVNVLLMGTTNEGLADTIILISFDPETQELDAVSVPRDTYYKREGYSSSYLKINAVAHEGADAMAKAVHEVLLGIPINYYAIIDYDGVANIVNEIGGVPMNVPRNMVYSSPPQNLYINIKAGEQILDGEKSVQYLRYRSGYRNGDIGRVEAQQAFIKSAVKQVFENKLTKVAKVVADNVDSDITTRAILYLADKASGMDPETIRTFLLPGTSGVVSGSSLSFWRRADDSEIEAMLREIYAGPESVTGGAITDGAVTDGAVAGKNGTAPR
ncbi:MAG: LCP family protein [Clostridiales Family XIII bacterium]|nr:LCP family protein [Clostridiales Family XIII bacterium]